MKRNYNEEMKEIIDGFGGQKKTLLLHSCCAPCSSAVVERLQPFFDITILYYNPNILPKTEYEKRRDEQKRFIQQLNDKGAGIKFIECDYEPEQFACAIKGKESMPEGSERCKECYRFRLAKTAEIANKNQFEYFTTTLSVSPYKHAEWLNEILEQLAADLKMAEANTKALIADFKKENGYLRSTQLAKEYNLYRQEYCGCNYKNISQN